MKHRFAFTLVEILVSITLTIVLVGLMASVITASLDTIGISTRSVEQSDGVAHLLAELHRDLRGLSEFEEAQTGAFYLSDTDEETIMAIARLEPAVEALDSQGYVRHVVYRWDHKAETLTRAAYHSARDREQILGTGSDPNGAQHTSNLERLNKLTPAYSGKDFEWLNAPEIKEALKRAEEVPLIANVSECKIECFENASETKDDGATGWSDAEKTPFAIRVSVRARTSGLSQKVREFKLWIPIQTLVAGGAP